METPLQPLSRRRLAQLLGLGAAATALHPVLAGARAAAQQPAVQPASATAPSGVVRLSSNENPYGPSPAAFAAMQEAFAAAWRYPDEAVDALAADVASHLQVGTDHILLGNGSSEILKLSAAAFTGPGRPAVTAAPTFEALALSARTAGAEVIQVPLTADYAHDLPRMLAAAGTTGLVYVCNPNNPTATITPKEALRDFLAALPPGATALVDEAYFHYADEPAYASVIPLVAAHPNLIVARTFSKIYGLAGLRCGFAVAQPQTLARLRAQQPWDTLNAMALAAAGASLKDTRHVEEGRRLNRTAKLETVTKMVEMGFTVLPSAANFVMIDLRRPVGPVIEALRARKVEVGRVFPALPTHLRVTIGTRPQMRVFAQALGQVLA